MSNGNFLTVEIGAHLGSLHLDISFALTARWTCLFGASGSGKTSILRAITGSLLPDRGRIALGESEVLPGGQLLFDQATHLSLPPHRRAVRSAAQQAWLFPGTVSDNVGYGTSLRTRRDAVEEVLARFRLAALADTRVESLSGGERQRVSLARGVAAALHGDHRIGLLLLDEPFAGMDAPLRDQLAPELRDWLRERKMPVLSVTHDVGEPFLLRAEVVRVAAGRVTAQGPASEVLSEEKQRLRAMLDS